ncbi:MAG: hypothetical protein VKJ24_01115 [Synechococcales bacterium]|nr:hypothetical protein [Synechococcales bacterium]
MESKPPGWSWLQALTQPQSHKKTKQTTQRSRKRGRFSAAQDSLEEFVAEHEPELEPPSLLAHTVPPERVEAPQSTSTSPLPSEAQPGLEWQPAILEAVDSPAALERTRNDVGEREAPIPVQVEVITGEFVEGRDVKGGDLADPKDWIVDDRGSPSRDDSMLGVPDRSPHSKSHRLGNDKRAQKRLARQRSQQPSNTHPILTRSAVQQQISRTGKATLRGIGWMGRQMGRGVSTSWSATSAWATPIVQQHQWTILFSTLLALAAGTGTIAIWWLSRLPPPPECDKLGLLSTDSDKLECAHLAAQTGKAEDVVKAIQLIQDWDQNHPLHGRSQRSLEQWTGLLMNLARERLAQKDLDGAIQLTQQIPESSPIYAQVQEEVTYWQAERNRGQKLYDKILESLKQQFWNDASGLLAKLTLVEDASWQSRLPEIRKLISDEKAAGFHLKQAQVFAKNNPPQTWGRAIALTDPINRETFVWQSAIKEIQTWRDQIFALAAQKLGQRDVATAATLVQSIPRNVEISPENRNLVRLVRASEVDAENNPRSPLLNQLIHIWIAKQNLQEIDPKSRFRKSADNLSPRLDLQVEDLFQIEIARTMASLGQVSALEGAIVQAQQVQTKRPLRLQAQTLIAQWQQDVERIEDRPILTQAEQLAKTGNLNQLRQAVQLIAQIQNNRAFYRDAQTNRNTWVAQIQIQEDRPILNEARSIAQGGQLGRAVQVASRIAAGRALYGEAQQEIANWADQLQAIEDRAILDRAAGLAATGSLSQAIEVASQVRSSRVYGEAQAAIGRWAAERDAALRARQAPVEPEPTNNYDEPPPANDPYNDSYNDSYGGNPGYQNPAPVPAPEAAPAPEPAPPVNEPEPSPPAAGL